MQHSAQFVPYRGATVYTDILEPAGGARRRPVVMVHGGGHTGSCYLLTADNRPGWAYRFGAAGFPVWLPDWPGCGRSGDVAFEELGGELVAGAMAAVVDAAAATSPDGKVVLMGHSMGGALSWKIVELTGSEIASVVAVAPGPPGNIQPHADVVSRTEDEIVVRSFGMTRTLSRTRAYSGGAAFVSHKLVGKSARFPRENMEMYAGHVAAVPPRLLIERQNVDGGQIRIDDTSPFRGLPVLVFTGSDDTDHPKDVDGAVVDWLRECGADVEFCWLPDRGVVGNGHMLMMEDNSDELADMILAWLDNHAG